MKKTMWVICSCCEGEGKVDNPAFGNGFTGSEWAEMDYDEREDYLEGCYDVLCRECGGSGKVQVPNVAALSFAEKRELGKERKEQRERAEFDRICALERKMGA